MKLFFTMAAMVMFLFPSPPSQHQPIKMVDVPKIVKKHITKNQGHVLPKRMKSRPKDVRRSVKRGFSVRMTIRTAIQITHVPASWIGPLIWIAYKESTDNPSAMAQEGTYGGYAEGLMQMLPSTFDAYAPAGLRNIWNPVDNVVASIRYIESRYGYPWAIPGLEAPSYRGY